MKKLLLHPITHTVILILLLFTAQHIQKLNPKVIKNLQYITFDTYNQLYERPAESETIIADIDEKSLVKIGQWPWPRDILADLVTKLKENGAKAIVFDIVFSDPDRTNPKELIKLIEHDEDLSILRDKLSAMPDNDARFAQAIKDSKITVTGFTAAQETVERHPALKVPVKTRKLVREELEKNLRYLPGVANNLPIIRKSAAGNGSFFSGDQTGAVIRKVPLFIQHGEGDNRKIYPSLAVEAVRVYQHPKTDMKILKNKAETLWDLPYIAKIGKYSVPLDKNGKLWVHFRKTNRKTDYVSASDILDQSIDPEKIQDKIVFIGTSAEGLKDLRSTPLDNFIPGVESHLNIAEQIIHESYIERPPFAAYIEGLSTLVIGLLLIILLPFVGTLIVGAFTILTISGGFLGAWYAYTEHGIMFDPVYPSIVLIILFIGSSILSYIRSESSRKTVRNAFSHYISPIFMEELSKNPDKLSLGGEVRELSVLFSDVRNFTTISEGLTPEALIGLMNDFLTPMSTIIMEQRGTIDKYMGDAVMAFWNAPLDDKNHAINSCRAALMMQDALKPLNEKLKQEAEANGTKFNELSTGIGINTGPCSVGNMGSRQRFAYSALGDAVNLASRLEGQTKYYGVPILVGEETAAQAKDFALLEMDLIRVKGKEQPVRIFALIGDEGMTEKDDFSALKKAHNEMLNLMRSKQFDEAEEKIKECQKYCGSMLHKSYFMYTRRISEYRRRKLPEDWDGVFVATSK